MKKILAIVLAAVMVTVLAAAVSAELSTEQVSCDEVYINNSEGARVDLANFGGNSQDDTQLGDITEKVTESFQIFGWHASAKKIAEFGYRYGDDVVLGSPKATTEDAVVAAGAATAGETGESVRFDITVPVKAGDDVEVFAVAKYEDGTTADLWRVVYTFKGEAEAPAEEVKGEDKWLCGDDPSTPGEEAWKGAPGWWFNPVGERDDRYVNVNFKADSAFSGVRGFYYASNPPATPELEYAKMTVDLVKDGNVVATAELAPVGDDWADVDFGKAFEAGEYQLRYSCKSGSGVENNCWCVIGAVPGSSDDVSVEANVNTPQGASLPILKLIGAKGGSTTGGTTGGKTNPKTSDASVVAIAAVAVVALAGVVVAKKVR